VSCGNRTAAIPLQEFRALIAPTVLLVTYCPACLPEAIRAGILAKVEPVANDGSAPERSCSAASRWKRIGMRGHAAARVPGDDTLHLNLVRVLGQKITPTAAELVITPARKQGKTNATFTLITPAVLLHNFVDRIAVAVGSDLIRSHAVGAWPLSTPCPLRQISRMPLSLTDTELRN